jgi:hypothetical protein
MMVEKKYKYKDIFDKISSITGVYDHTDTQGILAFFSKKDEIEKDCVEKEAYLAKIKKEKVANLKELKEVKELYLDMYFKSGEVNKMKETTAEQTY